MDRGWSIDKAKKDSPNKVSGLVVKHLIWSISFDEDIWKDCREELRVLVAKNDKNSENFTLKSLLVGNYLYKKARKDVSSILFIRLKAKNLQNSPVSTLKVLLDTGCTATLVSDKFCKNLKT